MTVWARTMLRLVAVLGAAVCAPAQSVAVLPFANVSATSGNLDWIGESIAETLREALASKNIVTLERDGIETAFGKLRLKSHAAITEASALKLGKELDAEQILYGTFVFAASAAAAAPAGAATGSRGSLRIAARLIDRRKLRSIGDATENGALEDLAKLEAHLAWRALTLLAPGSAPPEAEAASLRPDIRLDAEESFIRGLMAAGSDQEKYFRQAASLEPRYSRPALHLGKILYERKQYRDGASWLERVGAADPRHRHASFLLGLARFELGDYAVAQRAFQSIAQEVPLSEVFNNLAAAESRRNLPQAEDDFRKALEGDSNDVDYHFNLGYVLWKKNDFSGAADQFREVLVRNPGDQVATLLLGRCLKKQGLRLGDTKGPDARFQALERMKTNYEEKAYRQLKSVLESKTK